MGTWLQSLGCLQERAVETERFSEERGGVLLEWKGAVLGWGVDRGVVSISQKHQAWLQRLQDWRWWRTFCSSSNLGFLLELGDRYFFFSPGSRGGKHV